jgi:hypothetical protein
MRLRRNGRLSTPLRVSCHALAPLAFSFGLDGVNTPLIRLPAFHGVTLDGLFETMGESGCSSPIFSGGRGGGAA